MVRTIFPLGNFVHSFTFSDKIQLFLLKGTGKRKIAQIVTYCLLSKFASFIHTIIICSNTTVTQIWQS